MKLLKVAVLLMFAHVLAGCGGGGGGGGDGSDELYAIGDTGPSGVGTVFYITDGGLHGLEVAPSGWGGGASDPTSAWSNIDSIAIGAHAEDTAIGTGLSNSNAVIAQAGHASSAAKLCRDYRGGGKTDWFLPSFDELNELYVFSLTGFANSSYWSSTESGGTDSARYAQTIIFKSTGGGGPYAKYCPNYVRPVRAF